MNEDLPIRIDEAALLLTAVLIKRDVSQETIAELEHDFDRIRAGDGGSCRELATLALAVGLPFVESSLLEIGAELDHPECLIETAARLAMFGDRNRSIELLERAVALEYPSAFGQLAQRLQNADPERSALLAARGMELGDAYSHMLIGDLASEHGALDEARTAYGAAAAMGLELAQTRMLEVEDAILIGDFGVERFGRPPWDFRYQPPVLWIFDASAAHLQMDEEWSLQEDDGWSWWPHWARTRVTSSQLTWFPDLSGWHVTVETDVLRAVKCDRETVFESLNEISAALPLCALVYNEERGTVRLVSTFVMHTTDRSVAWWFRGVLSEVAVIHASLALRLGAMHESFDAEPDATAPDGQPIRSEPDEVLGVWNMIRERGTEPSRFAGVPILTLRKQFEQRGRDFNEVVSEAAADAKAIHDPTSIREVMVEICSDPPAWVAVTTDWENPFVGNGALAVLMVGGEIAEGSDVELAAHLNSIDAVTKSDWGFHGAWQSAPGRLSFNTFIPNSFAEIDTGLNNLIYSHFHRFRWLIREALDLPDERRQAILANHAATVGNGYGRVVQ